jgi:hypothetical protein
MQILLDGSCCAHTRDQASRLGCLFDLHGYLVIQASQAGLKNFFFKSSAGLDMLDLLDLLNLVIKPSQANQAANFSLCNQTSQVKQRPVNNQVKSSGRSQLA